MSRLSRRSLFAGVAAAAVVPGAAIAAVPRISNEAARLLELHAEIRRLAGEIDRQIAEHQRIRRTIENLLAEPMPRPCAVGWVFNVPAALVDPGRVIFAVNDGPVNEISAVRDGGVELLFGRNYPTIDALSAASIPLGGFATCFADGLFRLGSAPVRDLTADFDAGGLIGRGYFVPGQD